VVDLVTASLAGRKNVGVAVSGGADSVFLLTTLAELGAAAAVLHVNHGLRGTESDADEEFVRALAENLGLPFHSATLRPSEGNIEQQARRLRYAFFAERMAGGICDSVATGHTLDDQAETVLYRFLRGSGTAGLSGILPVTGSGVIRPILHLRRAEIRLWLTAHNIAWREDQSNQSPEFQRNIIRMNILPALAQVNPSLPLVLASTADWARAEEEYWATELDRLELQYLMRPNPETAFLQIEPFVGLPVAVQRRLLRRAIERVRGNLRAIGFQHVEAIRQLMASREGSGRIQLPELDVYRSFDQLRIAPQHYDASIERDFCVHLAVPGETTLQERCLSVRMELSIPSGVYNSDLNALDRAKCNDLLDLRNWRPGDQLECLGHSGPVKIKTLFQEYRVPLWERRRWPVIVMGDVIVWTRRFGVARAFAATPESRSVLLVSEARATEPGANGQADSIGIESGRQDV
jgi:tRNA(Ile)-lysidine synthase